MSRLPGPLRLNPTNPLYFADPEGNAVYLTGSHTWSTMQDLWIEGEPRRVTDFNALLEMLQEHGHNFLRFWQWMHPQGADWSETPSLFDPVPFERTGPGLARDGKSKFDLSRIDPAYIHRLRERVVHAGERGIYVGVMLFEGWTIKWPRPHTDPWPYHPMHPDNNVNGDTDNPVLANGQAWDVFSLNCPQLLAWQKHYVRTLVESLNDQDHVLFEVANEVPMREEAYKWTEAIIDFVREVEATLPKKHVIGFTSEGGEMDNARLDSSNADWISPSNGVYFEYRYDPPVPTHGKVSLLDTDHLWGHGGDPAWVWKAFTRGHNPIFMDAWEPIPGDLDWWYLDGVPMNRRYYHAWDPVRRNLGDTRRYALRLDLNRARPCPELTTTRYGLGVPNGAYVFFLPEGGFAGFNLRETDGTFTTEWFYPATGEVRIGDPIEGGLRHALRTPFPGPSVLFLARADAP